jgi:hypothetical protein
MQRKRSRGRSRCHDEDQMTFDFSQRIEDLCETVQAIAECDLARQDEERTDRSKAEFYIEVSAACKRAIRESGFSRAQIVDLINENWKPLEEEEDQSQRPALTKPMLDNYLSKPVQSRLPAWLIYAICEVTTSLEPLAVQAANLGGQCIAAHEKTELTLGKIEAQLRIGTLLKRDIIKRYGTKIGDKGDGLSD